MNAIEYARRDIDALRRQTNATLKDTTDEQLNWTPPGTANPISVTLLHTISGEDLFVQEWLQGKPTLWNAQHWSTRIGVETPPGGNRGWDEACKASLKLSEIMAYQEAVCEATSAYLASLQPEDLDRKVILFGSERTTADVLVMLVSHATGHIGEIAALKGFQGLKGLPF